MPKHTLIPMDSDVVSMLVLMGARAETVPKPNDPKSLNVFWAGSSRSRRWRIIKTENDARPGFPYVVNILERNSLRLSTDIEFATGDDLIEFLRDERECYRW